ncbi:piggyBac transposable element-derived protein 4-like [Battus philenor]|uniref:piggyBac transposable element-derived protein 4-like n=1 Tax=Battus philenor TaxID=42288 RepID=UPI0035CFD38E
MTCKRFKKILENLHVCDITAHLPRDHKDHDKLQKVRPLLDYLNRTYQENATNSESQSVDESMIKFKGRDSKKQYMPAKPIKRGFKAWCDSKTGYLYQCDIYTGKDQTLNEEGLGYRVVMKLGGNLPRNTHLVFDNFFSSLALMEALHHRGILATETVRMNRKGLPKELCPPKPKTPEERRLAKENKLDPGEFTYRFCHPCAVIKWHDTKEVFVLTTAVNPTKMEVIQRTQKNGQKKDMYCPSAIAEYTRSMGGVDHFDHYRSSYSIGLDWQVEVAQSMGRKRNVGSPQIRMCLEENETASHVLLSCTGVAPYMATHLGSLRCLRCHHASIIKDVLEFLEELGFV